MKLALQKLLAAICGAIVVALMLSFLLSGCTPVRYVYVDPKDSIVKKQIVEYDNVYVPLYFNYNWYSRPYYYYQPQRIVVTVPRRQSLPSRPPRGKH